MGITTKTGVDENGQSSSSFVGRAIGDIIPHFGTTPPPGTLVCDGSEISRETYHELYEEIGALCGPGDGSTTFELPDLRDVWLVWAGTQRSAGTEVAEGLPEIIGSLIFRDNNVTRSETTFKGNVTAPTGNGVFNSNNNPSNGFENMLMLQNTPESPSATEISFAASRSSSIYGSSAHVTPASVAVLPCIVYE